MSYQFDRLRVLVVDDNAHMRKLVITILQALRLDSRIAVPSR